MKSHQSNEPPLDQQLGEQLERAEQWLKKYLPKLLPIAAGLIVVLWLASGIYSVNPGHVGVVRTFGKETARTQPVSYELFLGKRSTLLLSADSPLFQYLAGPRPEADKAAPSNAPVPKVAAGGPRE